jgi:hypothetical protein
MCGAGRIGKVPEEVFIIQVFWIYVLPNDYNPTARQLVGKTRWVFRQPQGLSTERVDMDDYSNWMTPGIGPIRPTEDPAGLPYKLSSGLIYKGFQ